ncbi:MAG: hypothetical protein ACPGJS_05055 [Flammeovirgaceae bacterium]
MPIPKKLLFLPLILLSFLLRLWSYQQTPFANGWDSYFYLIQIKALVEEGQMHSADLSLIYPLMTAIHFLVGDYVFTFKVTAALITSCFVGAAGFLVYKFSQNGLLALLAVAFAIASPHLTYFGGQYPKNLLGLVFFLLFVSQIPQFFGNGVGKRQWIICLSLLVVNVFGHRMTAVLSVSLLCLSVVLNRISLKWLCYLLLAFGGLLVLGIVLPGILSVADFDRFNGFLTATPQFAPYSFWQSFGNERISDFWLMEIIASIIFCCFPVVWLIKHPKQKQAKPMMSWFILCSLLIFPFFRWSLDGIGYRFFLVFVLLAPFGFWLFLDQVSKLNRKLLLSTIGGLVLISFWTWKSYQSKQHDPPYPLYQKLTARTFEYIRKSETELVIAHKSLAELFTFSSGIDALPWIPEYQIEKERLWRIATDLNRNQFEFYLPESQLFPLSANYYLVREDQWQKFLQALQADGETETLTHLNSWKNPHQIRPYYLLKNKK